MCVFTLFFFGNQAEPVIQNALKSTIKYYASPEDQTQTVSLSWDAIMSQVK